MRNEFELRLAWLRGLHGPHVVERALRRFRQGDVRRMNYGIAVRTCRELDRDRKRSGVWAFWPSGDGISSPFRCRCREIERDGVCSHGIAVLLFEDHHCGGSNAPRNYRSGVATAFAGRGDIVNITLEGGTRNVSLDR